MKQEKPSRNEDEYFAREDAELLRKQRERAQAAAAEAERKSHYLKCPKDGYDLATSEYHGVQIETCPHCGGMWLDKGELEMIEEFDRRGTGLMSSLFRPRRSRPSRCSCRWPASPADRSF